MTKKGKPEVKRDGGAHPQQLLSGSLDAKLDNRQKVCSHYTYEGKVHLKQMLLSIVAYTHCLPCQICPKDSIVKNEDLENLKNGGGQQLHKKKNKTKKGSGTRKVQANVAKIDIWVCLTCAGHFCAAAGDIRADSHARGHAMQTEHWWAVKYVDPTTVYCFKCALVVPVNMGIIADEEAETATPDAYFVIQGLSSLGTVSCFNALLQNLLALTPLREEMLRLDFPRKAHICVALKKLIKRTRRTTQGGISPEQEYLLSKIYSMFPHFRISHMLDSEASLRSFLHALHTEEKEAWAGIPEDVNSTIVESIFEGQCSITISCNECSHCLVDYEEFCYLSLTAPLSSDSTEAADGADDKVDEINGPISLENCLKLYTDPEPWFCEKCAKAEGPKIDEEGQANKNQQKDDDMKVSVGATRRVLISAPPTVLALHLKRFSQSKRLEEGHVHYKEDLHIGPFVDPRSGVDDHVTYRLVGVLLHKETTTGGHYIANVRADRLIQRGSIVFWYNAIDGQVKKTSFESFEGEPHLLFYQKIMPENVSEEDMSVVKKANKNKQLEVTGKEIHGKGSVPDMIESHDEKVMPENVSEEDMGVVKKANKNKQWEVTGKEVHGKGSVPDMIESHDEQCLTNASQSSPNLTQEGTQLADIRMGEKSQLADINMQLQTGASVSDLSRPPLDEVLPWDYQRTRNPSRKARNKIAQDDDIVGQKIGFFLDRYILNGDRKPYYHFELVTMCERGSGSQQLNIHYSHLLEFSKDVAMDVCNGYTSLRVYLKETAMMLVQNSY